MNRSQNSTPSKPNEEGYYVLVHGVRIKLPVINEAYEPWVSSWKSLDYTKDIADSFLRNGFYNIEVRDTLVHQLKYIHTINSGKEK